MKVSGRTFMMAASKCSAKTSILADHQAKSVPKRLFAPIHGDNMSGANRFERPHGHVPQSADADDHHRASSCQQREHALYRVVGTHTRVGQGRGLPRFQGLDRDEAGNGNDYVIGQTPSRPMPGCGGRFWQ